MSVLTRLVVLVMKIEAVPGVAETLAASDGGILLRNATFADNPENIVRDFLTSDFSPFTMLIGKRTANIGFESELKGSGDPGDVAPKVGVPLQGCGFLETADPGVDHVYTPVSSGFKTLTIGLFRQDEAGNWVRLLISGAMGNVQFQCSGVGDAVYANFEFSGRPENITDTSPPGPITLDSTTEPPQFLNVVNTLGGYDLKINQFNINMQNQVILPARASHASGHGPARITGRTPIVTCDPEMVVVADNDFYGKRKNRTLEALVLGPFGTVAGNRFDFGAPKHQITGLTEGNREDLQIFNQTGLLVRDSGNDELVLTFD